MKLFVESLLPVDPATAWELFESEAFEQRLAQQTRISSEKLEERPDGDQRVFRRMKYRSDSELPSVVAKALGSKNLNYEQSNHMNRATSRMEWTVQLPVLTDRVKVAGSTTIYPHPQGCRRVVDGDITVNVPLVGGQIEKVVVQEFEKSMTRAVDIVRQLIAERGLAK